MEIIVRKNPKHSMFRKHYNSALGKMYHTKDDYLKDMKSGGFQPYSGPKKKSDPVYKSSKWAHDMASEIKSSKGKVGGRFYDELAKKGYTREKLSNMNSKKAEMQKKLDKGEINHRKGGFK